MEVRATPFFPGHLPSFVKNVDTHSGSELLDVFDHLIGETSSAHVYRPPLIMQGSCHVSPPCRGSHVQVMGVGKGKQVIEYFTRASRLPLDASRRSRAPLRRGCPRFSHPEQGSPFPLGSFPIPEKEPDDRDTYEYSGGLPICQGSPPGMHSRNALRCPVFTSPRIVPIENITSKTMAAVRC